MYSLVDGIEYDGGYDVKLHIVGQIPSPRHALKDNKSAVRLKKSKRNLTSNMKAMAPVNITVRTQSSERELRK